MNREIKFRVWVDWCNKMEYPDFIMFHSDGAIETDKSQGGVVMQFTGLKDFKNQPIYEGDIVRYTGSHYQYMTVNYNPRIAAFCAGNRTFNLDGFSSVFTDEIEVVGNIFETPELLRK